MPDLYPIAGPLLRLLPPEWAHAAALRALRAGLVPEARAADDPVLATRLWSRDFPNPIGLAPGLDKDGQAIDATLALGFGFVEVGGVTPLPQPGNPRPRLFRLAEDRAIVNRMGFNSAGHASVAARMRMRARRGIVGVNLGRNKESADAAADFIAGLRAFAPFADFVTVNVSSPNTPGLRDLQGKDRLRALLAHMVAAHATLPPPAPVLLVKIAADLDEATLADLAEVALESRIDGLIVGNTILARPTGLRSRHSTEEGGLSGAPLLAPSTAALARIRKLTRGKITLIGCGGVASGADAYAKIRAGASLVQLYTALIYQGPALVGRIKRDLAALLHADGFGSVAEAVGSAPS